MGLVERLERTGATVGIASKMNTIALVRTYRDYSQLLSFSLRLDHLLVASFRACLALSCKKSPRHQTMNAKGS